MIKIRDYDKNDYFDIVNIISEDVQCCNDVSLNNALLGDLVTDYDGENIRCYVAVDGKKIVGFIYGFILPNCCLLPEFSYIKPTYRNKGIGSLLLTYLEQHSSCMKSRIFYNNKLTNHYSKLGYNECHNLRAAEKILDW